MPVTDHCESFSTGSDFLTGKQKDFSPCSLVSLLSQLSAWEVRIIVVCLKFFLPELLSSLPPPNLTNKARGHDKEQHVDKSGGCHASLRFSQVPDERMENTPGDFWQEIWLKNK